MATDRLLRFYELIESEGGVERIDSALSIAAATFVDVTGASVSLVNLEQTYLLMSSSNDVAAGLFDLEFTVREGPLHDLSQGVAIASDHNLASREPSPWPVLSPLAREIGVMAVFSFPVQVGPVRIGALTLYRDVSGPLSDAQTADAFLVTSVTAKVVLAQLSGVPFGSLPGDLVGGPSFDFTVYQAAGMVAVQASRSIEDALTMLRSHAFGVNVGILALARLVVERKIFFDARNFAWVGECDATEPLAE